MDSLLYAALLSAVVAFLCAPKLIPILRKMEISIPKIEVQEKIAKILFDLDTKIALNNQMIDTLEEMDLKFPVLSAEDRKDLQTAKQTLEKE